MYTSIAHLYDFIFPVPEAMKRFTLKKLQHVHTVLEIGCATGNLLSALSDSDFDLYGFDFDKTMTDAARKKLHLSMDDGEQKIIQGDMKHLDALFQGRTFDGVLCYGNTIAHLSFISEVDDLLGKIDKRLNPGGTLIIQILNYERIIAEKIESLPIIENEKIRFRRNYIFSETSDSVGFHTILEDMISGEVFENEIELLMIRPEELISALENSGFTNVESYGSFAGEPFDPRSSYHLIVCAGKAR